MTLDLTKVKDTSEITYGIRCKTPEEAEKLISILDTYKIIHDNMGYFYKDSIFLFNQNTVIDRSSLSAFYPIVTVDMNEVDSFIIKI